MITHVCIDDFAVRKGRKYGSLMVDLHTNRIIDMIATREYEPVSERLKSYPNLRVISRDGSITYKNAIESSHPEAIQVSDRFHLLKNLTTYTMEYLRKKLKVQIALSLGEQNVSCENSSNLSKSNENRKRTAAQKYAKIEELGRLGCTKWQICKEINMNVLFYEKLISMTPLEREKLFKTNLDKTHEEKIELKMQRVNEVRELKAAGFSIRAIAKRTKLKFLLSSTYPRSKTTRYYGGLAGCSAAAAKIGERVRRKQRRIKPVKIKSSNRR